MLVTLQTEVAARLAAAPGSREYGLVSVHVQRLYEVAIVRRIPGSCFFPPPEVESSVVRLDLRPRPLAEPRSMPRFRALLKGAFTRRRKQIQRALQDMGWLPRSAANDGFESLRRIGIDPAARPETLSVEQWGALADAAEDWGAPALESPEASA
jgi:16S rRNA (adenine1518-N6/adenine1519-N6)-dimethyltransferase